MTHPENTIRTTKSSGSAVLLARIVDALERGIQCADVASIRYSLVECDLSGSHDVCPVAGHDQVLLNVRDVVYETLQFRPPWNVDEVGYNFRHELELDRRVTSTNGDKTYELRYELTPQEGEVVVLRFELAAKQAREA